MNETDTLITSDIIVGPHSVVLVVHCVPAGADLDAMLETLRTLPGVVGAEDVATYDHARDARTVYPAVTLPAAPVSEQNRILHENRAICGFCQMLQRTNPGTWCSAHQAFVSPDCPSVLDYPGQDDHGTGWRCELRANHSGAHRCGKRMWS